MSSRQAERIARVRQALEQAGLPDAVVALEANTATAAQAAAALGCTQGEIAKSLMFRAAGDDRPVLAVLPGDKRVCTKKLARVAGDKVVKADADFVKTNTGYEIGGVPPLAHRPGVQIVLDAGLERYEIVWAAAGSAYAVFSASPAALAAAASAEVADIAEDPA